MNERERMEEARVTRRDFLGAAAGSVVAATLPMPTPGASAGTTNIDALVSRMTLEEKLGQLTQLDGRPRPTNPAGTHAMEGEVRKGRVGSFLGVFGAARTRRLQAIAVERSRLGIPLLFAEDVIHGFRTIFPVPIAEAASFDIQAVERAARIAAVEATAHGVHWTFAPMIDVARDPRWGRIVEGAGEDPYLGSVLAAARVRGFQGDDLAAPDTLLATAKHFVAYGAAEGGRDYNIADVSLRTLHETYLPPFAAAIKAGVQSVMVAFNEVAGLPMHANGDLIRDLLRARWGFDGLIISDYDGVRELIKHGVAANGPAAASQALLAGIDIDMASGVFLRDLPARLTDERVSVRIDESVRRILQLKQRLGLFADPYRYCDPRREKRQTLTPEHRSAAREMARKSFVLLENRRNVLPLSRTVRTIAVIGPHADAAADMLGSWSAAGSAEDVVTALQGIRAVVDDATRVLHVQGASTHGPIEGGLEQAAQAAQQADVVLLFIGEHRDMSGEARSRASLDVPDAQEALARVVIATGKPVVVVLFAGRPLAISWLAEHAAAILLAWFPGVEAGNALADTLFGDCNPAGRLPVTFPREVGQVPIYYNHKNTGRPFAENEDNTSKYIDALTTPLYPFGYGLSYTQFTYERLRLSAPRIRTDDTLEVRVDVVNGGLRAGEEVVQLYVRDDVASVTPPVRQLRAFERIHLEVGERRTIHFELGPDDLSICGPDLRRVVEPGTFTVFVGGSSIATLQAQFVVA